MVMEGGVGSTNICGLLIHNILGSTGQEFSIGFSMFAELLSFVGRLTGVLFN